MEKNEKNKGKNRIVGDNAKKDFFIPNADSIHLETSLRDRFRVLLNRIGRSQNWLADEVGVSNETLWHIVSGLWFPSSDIMIRICKVLECEAPALFGDNKHWKIWSDKMIYQKEKEDGKDNE